MWQRLFSMNLVHGINFNQTYFNQMLYAIFVIAVNIEHVFRTNFMLISKKELCVGGYLPSNQNHTTEHRYSHNCVITFRQCFSIESGIFYQINIFHLFDNMYLCHRKIFTLFTKFRWISSFIKTKKKEERMRRRKKR